MQNKIKTNFRILAEANYRVHLLNLIATQHKRPTPYKIKREIIHEAIPSIYPTTPNDNKTDRTCTGLLHLQKMCQEGLLTFTPQQRTLYTLTSLGEERRQDYTTLLAQTPPTHKTPKK